MAQEDGTEGPEVRQVPLLWVGVDDEPVMAGTHFLSQFTDDQFFLSIGVVSPPVILGTEEERRERAEELQYVPINVVSKIALTEGTLERLIEILSENLALYREKRAGGIGSEEEEG